jgi:hypothetical protein
MFVKRTLLVLLLLIASVLMIAAAPLQDEPPAGDIQIYVELATAAFAALIGWPALLSSVTSALLYFRVIAQSAADTFMFWANVVVFGGVLVLAILGKIDLVNQIDSTFGNLGQLLTYLLIILGVPMGLIQSKRNNEKILNTPLFINRSMK